MGAVISSGKARAGDGLSDSSSQARWSLSGSRAAEGKGAERIKKILHIRIKGQVWEIKEMQQYAHQVDEVGFDSPMNMDNCFLG